MTLKKAVFDLMHEKGFVSDQDIINKMGGMDFSFNTVKNYIYQYQKQKELNLFQEKNGK